jgi:flagellar motor switch protein FliG
LNHGSIQEVELQGGVLFMASERENGGIRQAAILMASVDSQTARQLLQQMPPATAKAVRRAMVDLGRIDAEEQQAVLAAFKSRVQPSKAKSPASPSATPQLRQDASGGTAPIPGQLPGAGSMPAMNAPHFSPQSAGSYWDQYSADQIIEVVTAERPTVIAVVLTQLQPLVANQVLGKLSNELRKEVLVQLSRLQQVEAEIIQEIKDQLQQKLALTRPIPYVDQELGMNRLKSILEAGDEQMKLELCQAIQESNELTGPIRYWVKDQLNTYGKAAAKDSGPWVGETTANSNAPVASSTSSTSANGGRVEPSAIPDRNNANGVDHQKSPAVGEVFDTAHSYVAFEDLKWIGLNQLAVILQNCDPKAMLVALTTADEELLNRVALLFSKRDWKRLNERLRGLGPVDDEDRLAARMIVAETAQRLLIGDDLNQVSKPVGSRVARAA